MVMNMWKKALPGIGFSAIALGAGGLSALISTDAMKQFDNLPKSPLAPPGWVFPAAWTLLYILMGVSAGIVWRKSSGLTRERAMWLWAVQLFFNFCWSFLFFNLQLRLLSFFWLMALLALVIAMTARFSGVSREAGALNYPYILWLFFAAYLNMGSYILNG